MDICPHRDTFAFCLLLSVHERCSCWYRVTILTAAILRHAKSGSLLVQDNIQEGIVDLDLVVVSDERTSNGDEL